jgi:hypothetical protein
MNVWKWKRFQERVKILLGGAPHCLQWVCSLAAGLTSSKFDFSLFLAKAHVVYIITNPSTYTKIPSQIHPFPYTLLYAGRHPSVRLWTPICTASRHSSVWPPTPASTIVYTQVYERLHASVRIFLGL